ncbi:MAG: transglutaminase-like domain-containing protein [Clostridia bacterium]|nr:transglutaminase-like domain-containing protein [Clostridia bacterium]
MSVFRRRFAVKFMLIGGACLMLLSAAFALQAIARAQSAGNHQILMPELSEGGKGVFSKSGVVIDHGNSSRGYVMVKYKESDQRLKVRITLNKKNYDYDLNGQGEYEVYPLQMGDGKYKITVFQEKKKNEYATVASTTITVKLDSPVISFLYPSQYVNYTADSKAVAKSFELCEGLDDDKEKVKAIFNFCRRISYNYALANSAKSGYLPDIDEVLASKKGICFDYAALMACMLRVQGIPTQLVIGYADRQYHAWNNVGLDGKWYRYDPTLAAMGSQAQNYTEERRY